MITDLMLNEMAKGLAGDSFVIPSHFAYSTDTVAITAAMTTISGEVSTRNAAGDVRTLNQVNFSGIRSGTQVTSSAGITLKTLGVFSASTSGTLLSAVTLPSILHTTTFDIDTEVNYTINRL